MLMNTPGHSFLFFFHYVKLLYQLCSFKIWETTLFVCPTNVAGVNLAIEVLAPFFFSLSLFQHLPWRSQRHVSDMKTLEQPRESLQCRHRWCVPLVIPILVGCKTFFLSTPSPPCLTFLPCLLPDDDDDDDDVLPRGVSYLDRGSLS